MATIQSSIQIMDRLTQPLMRMASAMSNLVVEMERANDKSIDPKGLDTMKENVARANAELRLLKAELGNAGGKTEQNTAKQRQWNSAIKGGNSAMGGLMNKLKAALGLYALIKGANKLVALSDEAMTIDARLNLITDNSGQKASLKNAVYQAAQEARAPLNAFTNDVAKLGILAGKRFSGNGEIIQFMGNAAKAFRVAGTSASETAGAMIQLNQALASGVLQGDEFRSIRENAPLITQAIAKEMGVSQDHLKKLARRGEITADVVRRAVLGMTDDINGKFSQLPMTWRDVWTKAGNFAVKTLEPLLKAINGIANSEKFQRMASEIANTFQIVAGVMAGVFQIALDIAGRVYDKWNAIKPVLIIITSLMLAYGIAHGIAAVAVWAYNVAMGLKAAAETAAAGTSFLATVAQHGLNKAIYAFPGTWIVAAVVAVIAVLIGLIVAAVYVIKAMTKTATVIGTVVGAFAWMGAMIWNIWAEIVNGTVQMVNGIIRGINSLITSAAKGLTNFANIFIDAFNWIMREATGFINGLLGMLSQANPILSKVGINIPSSVGGAIQLSKANFSGPQVGLINGGNDVMKRKDPKGAYDKWSKKGDKWQKGAEDWLKGGMGSIKDKMNDLFDPNDLGGGKGSDPANGGKGGGDVGKNTGRTADNTGKMADKLEDTEEEMKYLRELAEQEHINQFTTAEIKVEMNNSNNISKETDIDEMIRQLTEKLTEKMNRVAEGVH